LVERGSDAAVATFYTEEIPTSGHRISLGEAAARHAAVRRLSEGDLVRLTDGRGHLGRGAIRSLTKRDFVVAVDEVASVPAAPLLEVLVPVADRDRMLWLGEKCAELAVTIWQPVMFARSRSVSPRGEGDSFRSKLRARMISALEQSGGAWLPQIRSEASLAAATATVAARTRYLLHRSGRRMVTSAVVSGAAIVVGPEGGLEAAEMEHLVASGWTPVSLAPTTLRFETAGIAAVSILRAGVSAANGET
jgi:16S rRNA (uracil1498-N3)-methyltransferase